MKLFAPGKVFLAGEYAVLDGHPALVAAVDRGLHAECEPAPVWELVHAPSGVRTTLDVPAPPELRFAARAMQLARRTFGGEPKRLTFLDDLATEGQKLGLGGSAAATALAVRAVAPERTPQELLGVAVEAHWSEQGSGSGADVAASLFGGVIAARSTPGAPPTVEVERVPVPEELRLLLAFTGKSADTRTFVRDVRLFAGGEPGHWRRLSGDIADTCARLRTALEKSRADDALQAVRAAAAAMARLGEAAQVPIVTPELARIAALAASAGAAAKPSGAGGGDCAVVFSFGEAQRARAQAALEPEFFVLNVGLA